MEGLIAPKFAAILEANRDRFNAMFAQARRDVPDLDGGEFLGLVRRLDPIVSRAESVVGELYATLLEMFRRGLVGSRDRHPGFEENWYALMDTVVGYEPPGGLVGPMTNALYNLTVTPGCRPDDWTSMMEDTGYKDAEQVRVVGQVASWMCGMAQFRKQALEIYRADRRDCQNVLWTLSGEPDPWKYFDRLEVSPWYRPDAEPGLRIVAEVGSFRGLGGEFRRPPRVALHDGEFLVTDGTDRWLLFADAFGSTLHRVHADTKAAESSGPYGITKTGTVNGPSAKERFPMLGSPSSSAATETTLAVTLPHSHRVYLLSEVPA